MHETTLRVRYAETDQMGFVYHTHYLIWCEVGRTDLIRSLGMNYSELEQLGWLLAVAQAEIRYLAPARYEDLIRVHTRLIRVRSRFLTFSYEILRVEPGPPQRLVTATTELVALGPNGAPRSLAPELLAMFRNAIETESTGPEVAHEV